MDGVKRDSYTMHAETENGVTTLANGKTSDPVVVSAVVHAKLNSDQISAEFCPAAVSWLKWLVTTNVFKQQLKRGHPPHWRSSQ